MRDSLICFLEFYKEKRFAAASATAKNVPGLIYSVGQKVCDYCHFVSVPSLKPLVKSHNPVTNSNGKLSMNTINIDSALTTLNSAIRIPDNDRMATVRPKRAKPFGRYPDL